VKSPKEKWSWLLKRRKNQRYCRNGSVSYTGVNTVPYSSLGNLGPLPRCYLLLVNIVRRDVGKDLLPRAVSYGFFGGGFFLWCWVSFRAGSQRRRGRGMFFYAASLLFSLFPFCPRLCSHRNRFAVLPPTRAIQDHLSCVAADAGAGASLLGDQRSRASEPISDSES
jgi:hypothetical protein